MIAAAGVALGVASAAAAPPPPRLARLVRLGLPVYCGGGAVRAVAITFDDGPGPYTDALLRILRRDRVPASFFLVGNRIADWPRLPRAEARFGPVGNHTWSHANLARLSRRGAAAQLDRASAAIAAATGRRPLFFRPPYDEHPAFVDRLARRRGMLEVLYSVDAGDALRGGTTAGAVLRRIAPQLRPGGIVLLHDIHPWTLRVVPRLVTLLRRRHLRPVTLTRLLADDPPSLAQLRADARGRSCVAFPAR